jgi:hypothetical protein
MDASTPDRNGERKATSEAPGVHLPNYRTPSTALFKPPDRSVGGWSRVRTTIVPGVDRSAS